MTLISEFQFATQQAISDTTLVHEAPTRAHEPTKHHHANRKTHQKLVQFLGSENGTDFGPDPRTRTVHIHSFANIPVLQILHLYVSVCICVRARARQHAGARAPTRRHLCQGGRVCASSSGCTPAAPTYATCLLVVLASPRHARTRACRNRNWCDRSWFLVRPKHFFEKS